MSDTIEEKKDDGFFRRKFDKQLMMSLDGQHREIGQLKVNFDQFTSDVYTQLDSYKVELNRVSSNIVDKVSEFKDSLTSINITQTKILDKLDSLGGKVEDHDSMLSGDPKNLGKEGVVSTVQRHEQKLLSLPEELRKEMKHNYTMISFIWGGIVSVAGLIFTVIFNLFKHKN